MPNWSRGNKTESSGTPILVIVPPWGDMIARCTWMRYFNTGTVHTCTFMKALGETTLSAQAASGASTIEVTNLAIHKTAANPSVDENIAAADFVIWKNENGVYEADRVASVSGQVLTVDGTHAADADSGDPIWSFGAITDTRHIAFNLPVSVDTELPAETIIQNGFPTQVGIGASRSGAGDPMLIHYENTTAAGIVRTIGGNYTDKTNLLVG